MLAYESMNRYVHGRIIGRQLLNLMGQGCHLVTPSRNVLSMYCFFVVSHLNGIIFSGLMIMINIGRIAFILTLNGCKSSCQVSPIGLSCTCGTRVGNLWVVFTCGSLSSFL